MATPHLSFSALSNYARTLQNGTVTERASLQTIFDRVNAQLLTDYLGETLTLEVRPMSKDTTGQIGGLAASDELYELNGTNAASIVHLYLSKDNKPIRSIVLSMTEHAGKELFGIVNETKVYACPVVADGCQCSDKAKATPVKPRVVLANKALVMNTEGDWLVITGAEDGKLIYALATDKDLANADIPVGYPGVVQVQPEAATINVPLYASTLTINSVVISGRKVVKVDCGFTGSDVAQDPVTPPKREEMPERVTTEYIKEEKTNKKHK